MNEEESSNVDWELLEEAEEDELPTLKTRRRIGSKGRRKFITRWLKLYPWLRPHPFDKEVCFCTICARQLVNNKANIARHASLPKHILGQEAMNARAEESALEGKTEAMSVSDSMEFVECGVTVEEQSKNAAAKEESGGRFPQLKARRFKIMSNNYTRPVLQYEWLVEFPWLRAHPTDMSLAYCVNCNRQLTCHKQVISRHERCTGHIAALKDKQAIATTASEMDDTTSNTSEYNSLPATVDSDEGHEDNPCSIESELYTPNSLTGSAQFKSRRLKSLTGSYTRPVFQYEWLAEFAWLRPHPANTALAFCIYCSRQLTCSKTVISRHEHCTSHIEAMKKPPVMTTLKDINPSTMQPMDVEDANNSLSNEAVGSQLIPLMPQNSHTYIRRLKARRFVNQSDDYVRPEFQPEWLEEFAWLRAHPTNTSLAYCFNCNRQLTCSKQVISRHELSGSHLAAMKRQPVDAPAITFSHANSSTGFVQNPIKEMNGDTHADAASLQATHATENTSFHKYPFNAQEVSKSEDYVQETVTTTRIRRCGQPERDEGPKTTLPAQTDTDALELFFDSAKASAKKLPPRYTAEIKVRISQIIAEYELRVICQHEAKARTSYAVD